MTLKAGFAQVAAPTSTGTVDLTNSSAGFASDVKAAIIFSSYATSNDAGVSGAQVSLGIVGSEGGTTQISMATSGENGVGTPIEVSKNNTSKAFVATDQTAGFIDIADASSFLSNGVRLNFTTVSARARLINALLLGGDINAKCVSLTWTAESGVKSIAHGLPGTPGMIFAFSNSAKSDVAGIAGAHIYLGLWDGTTAVGVSRRNTNSANVQNVVEILDASHWILGAVGDTLTVSADGTNVSVNCLNTATVSWHLLCVYGANLKAKAGFFLTPTGTGDVDSVTGLAFNPQAALCIGTRQIAINSVTTDLADVFSIGVAALHSGTITQGSIADSSDDGAGSSGSPSTTTRKNWTSNTKQIRIPSDVGLEQVAATLSAFGSAKITHNYTNVNSAQEVAYLLIQETTSSGSGQSHPMSGKLRSPLGGKIG